MPRPWLRRWSLWKVQVRGSMALNFGASHGCGTRFVTGPAKCMYKACEGRYMAAS